MVTQAVKKYESLERAEKVNLQTKPYGDTSWEVTMDGTFTTFLFENVRPKSDEDTLYADVTVYSKDAIKANARVLLNSQRSRSELTGVLGYVSQSYDKTAWDHIFMRACVMVDAAWRNLDAVTDLRTVPVQDASSRWLLEPLLEADGLSMLFGPGDSLKSVLSLGVAVSIASGQVVVGDNLVGRPVPGLYIDWEDDAKEHGRRLRAICNGHGITVANVPLFHVRMSASLSLKSGDLKRKLVEYGAGFVIVDSLGMASGGDPEGAQKMIESLTLLRALNVPCLVIHHMSWDAIRNKRLDTYGSTYIRNEVRLQWGMVRADESKPYAPVVGLIQRKGNKGPTIEPEQSYLITFTNDPIKGLVSIQFSHEHFAAYPSLWEWLGKKGT